MDKLINFAKLKPESLGLEVSQLIEKNKQRVADLVKQCEDPNFQLSWENTSAKLDDWGEEIFDDLFSIAGHLKSVRETDALRAAYNKCLPKISEYATTIRQDAGLYKLMKRLRQEAELSEEQQKDLDDYIRDCKLTGIELPEKERAEFAALVAEGSKLSNKFSENILDATDKWKKHLPDNSRLGGIPEAMQAKWKQDAKNAGKDGYLLGLDMPSHQAIMTYAKDGELRKEVYNATVRRASSKDQVSAKLDNSENIRRIMLLRHKMARLLGFASPAEMLMATNMVREPGKVEEFVRDLLAKVQPAAQEEAQELKDYTLKHQDSFEPWDLGYYSEKLKQEKFNIDTEKMREYFPLPRVLQGMFTLAEKLFDVSLEEVKDFDSWHEDVTLFKLTRGKEAIGYLYCDLYARENKNGGAWMNESINRRQLTDGSVRKPAAYLVCNFRQPLKGNALLMHYDVTVLFHEFGHCLHHLLTKIGCSGIAGIHGVPHDMIELPSQLMENWCWDKEFIKLISSHHESGEPLPTQKLDELVAARNFHTGLFMLRQLEFSLFDILLHSKIPYEEFDKNPARAQECYDELRQEFNPLPQVKENYFPNAFSHVFAGGYAAGYYSYKWAEVMSADIYAMFEENGIYDKKSAEKLRQNIFERGGLGDAMQNFIAVRGREPDNTAFLRHNGVKAA